MPVSTRNASVAAIALLAASATAMSACADQSTDAEQAKTTTTQTTPSQDEEAALLAVSDEGNAAMREVHNARLAIFDAETDLAKEYVDNALSDLKSESADWTNYLRKAKDSDALDKDYIVIDGAIGLEEDFVPTPEKTEAVKKANNHIKKGNNKKAMSTLRLAGIDVTVSQVLMPLKETRDHLESARKMLKDAKYYEANLALKAAEDGLVIDAAGDYAPVDASSPSKSKSDSK